MSHSWRYVDGTLVGPSPAPPVPPVVSIHGAELGASAADTWAEVDQELRCVRVARVPTPHASWVLEPAHRYYLRGWQGAGWYAQYRRVGSRRFLLASVSADAWALIHGQRPRDLRVHQCDGDARGEASSSGRGSVSHLPAS